ncbi:hypothetical protein MMC32_001135 [Xylographa parallela]|nr:hypothetical protein [Xylographa parallela]
MPSDRQFPAAEITKPVDKANGDWIAKAKEADARESRGQPWKQTLQHEDVGTGFEGEDPSRIRARDDVQHSGVAG